jgi:hypothetical protein
LFVEGRVEMKFARDLGCVNPDCPKFGIKGEDNIIVRDLRGRDAIRFVRCRACRREFSERRGTALFNFRIRHDKFVDVVAHLAEGWECARQPA